MLTTHYVCLVSLLCYPACKGTANKRLIFMQLSQLSVLVLNVNQGYLVQAEV